MAESQKHIDLVRIMSRYVQTKLAVEIGHILIDLPDSAVGSKPPNIGSYRPDLFISNEKLLLIGEAKTESDWQKRHSLEQYKDYMTACLRHNGTSIILGAVPWHIEKSLRSRLLSLFTSEQLAKVQIIVISDMTRF